MSYIGSYFSRFLNSLYNPAVKNEEFISLFNNVYPTLKNGLSSFPELTSDFETLLEAIEIGYYPIINKLSWTENNQKIGYNPISIKSLTTNINIEEVLHDLDSEQVQLYVNLKSIFNSIKSIYTYKFYQHLFLGIDSLFEIDLTQFQSETESFGYILNREPFSETTYNHTQQLKSNEWLVTHNLNINENSAITVICYDEEGKDISSTVNFISRPNSNELIVIFNAEYSGTLVVERTFHVYPFLYAVICLYHLYSAATSYHVDLIYKLQQDNVLQDVDVKISFNKYINDSSSDISKEFATFVYRSIFAFSGDISPHLNSETLSTISEALYILPEIFNSASDDGDIMLQIYTYLSYDSASYIAYWSAIKQVHEDMYDRVEAFFDFPNGLDWYSQVDEVARANISDSISENTKLLTNLENTILQFKTNPIFFINAYFITHGKYARDLITSISPGFNVSELLENMKLRENIEDSLKQYVIDNFLEPNDDVIKFTAFLKFKSILITFIDSDKFNDWVISKLIPSLIKTVKIHYLITDVEVCKITDNIKLFFKTFFIKQLLEEKLFNDYISEFIDRFNSQLATVVPEITTSDLNFHASKFIDPKTLTNILNSYYKGTVISKYVVGALSTCSL